MPRVLITGVTGFVGRHLVRALVDDGAGFEIFGTAYPGPPSCAGAAVTALDLRSESEVRRIVRETRPDWVFHLAAVSNVRNSWIERRATVETNILGTHHLLESVRLEASRARVLFVSSSDVYGNAESPERPIEEGDPVRILNPYAYTKASGEMLCGFFVSIEGLDIVVARPFPHTGPGQSPDFVCSDWARQIVRIERGEAAPVLCVGNLDVKRDFSDVRDVVRAYLLLMTKGRRGEVYNVCSGKAVALRGILERLLAESDARSSVRVETDPLKLRKTDIPLLVGSRRKIEAETGWVPAIPFDRTLGDLLAFWRHGA
ncbi:MAG: GDP-mannose 4,6-dehydratase [Candidatus Aminicenantales bacterium]